MSSTSGYYDVTPGAEELEVEEAEEGADLKWAKLAFACQIDPKTIVQADVIGHGTCGIVRKAKWRTTKGHIDVAVKALRLGSEYDHANFLKNADLMVSASVFAPGSWLQLHWRALLARSLRALPA